MIHTIRLLCIAVFLACLIAVFFLALYFVEHRAKDYWRNRAERIEEYALWQKDIINRVEGLEDDLIIEGE